MKFGVVVLLALVLLVQTCIGCEKHRRMMQERLRKAQMQLQQRRLLNVRQAQTDAVDKLRRDLTPGHHGQQVALPMVANDGGHVTSRRLVRKSFPVSQNNIPVTSSRRTTYYRMPRPQPISDNLHVCNSQFACPRGYVCTVSSGGFTCRRPIPRQTHRPIYRPSYNYNYGDLRVSKSRNCSGGFKRVVMEAQNYDMCRDINECKTKPDVCGDNARGCHNSRGTYRCSCQYGYKFDGTTCVDVDECQPAPPVGRCTQICENTPGSYTCSCREGFRQTMYSRGGCRDIDECREETDSCKDSEYCLNLVGSYECVTENECPQNYTKVAMKRSTCLYDERVNGKRPDNVPYTIRYIVMPTATNTTRFIGSLTLSTYQSGVAFSVNEVQPNENIGYEASAIRPKSRRNLRSQFQLKFTVTQALDDGQEEYMVLDILETFNVAGGTETKIHRLDLTVFGYITRLYSD